MSTAAATVAIVPWTRLSTGTPPSMWPMKDLREVPTSSGKSAKSRASVSSFAMIYVLLLRLAEAYAGIQHYSVAAHATPLGLGDGATPVSETSLSMSATGSCLCIVSKVPRECMRTSPAS